MILNANSGGGNGRKSVIITATIGTDWVEDENTGIKSQTVSIDGVKESHAAYIDVVYDGDGTSDSYETFIEAKNQFLLYITNGYAETADGGIIFNIFGDANTVNIPIILEVV